MKLISVTEAIATLRFARRRIEKTDLWVAALQFWQSILRDAESSAKYARGFARYLGIACIVAFPAAFLVEQLLAPNSPSTLKIRVAAACACLGLIFFAQMRSYSEKLAAAYWVLLVGFAAIYTFSTMLILNAAFAPNEASYLTIWVFQYIAALFVAIQALSSWRLLLPIWALATIAALLNLLWVTEPNWDALKAYVFYPAPIFLTLLIFGALLLRRATIVKLEKMETAAAIGATIAHEIRTPLAAIQSFAGGISSHMPALLNAYELAKSNNLIEQPISTKRLADVGAAIEHIKEEVRYSNTIIEMLLISTGGFDEISKGDTCDAFECCRISTARFPYANDIERTMVRVSYVHNFKIEAPEIIVIHMLFNLMKNAIRHALPTIDREVTIAVGREGTNTISVRDSGQGIPKKHQLKVFERFFTTQDSGQGAGVGLSFCKTAMQQLGGSITWESDSSTFCEFTLRFD